MGHRRYLLAALGADEYHLQHEWDVVIADKPVGNRFTQDRRRERAKGFPALDLAIENILHVSTTGIAKNGAVAECTGALFHTTLEPTDHQAIGNRAGCGMNQLFFVRQQLDMAAFGFNE